MLSSEQWTYGSCNNLSFKFYSNIMPELICLCYVDLSLQPEIKEVKEETVSEAGETSEISESEKQPEQQQVMIQGRLFNFYDNYCIIMKFKLHVYA